MKTEFDFSKILCKEIQKPISGVHNPPKILLRTSRKFFRVRVEIDAVFLYILILNSKDYSLDY